MSDKESPSNPENDIRDLLGAVIKLSETQQSITQALNAIAAGREESLAGHNDHARAIKTLTETQSKIAALAGELANRHGQILKALNERITVLEIKAFGRPSDGEESVN